MPTHTKNIIKHNAQKDTSKKALSRKENPPVFQADASLSGYHIQSIITAMVTAKITTTSDASAPTPILIKLDTVPDDFALGNRSLIPR